MLRPGRWLRSRVLRSWMRIEVSSRRQVEGIEHLAGSIRCCDMHLDGGLRTAIVHPATRQVEPYSSRLWSILEQTLADAETTICWLCSTLVRDALVAHVSQGSTNQYCYDELSWQTFLSEPISAISIRKMEG